MPLKIDGFSDRQIELAELRFDAKQRLASAVRSFDAAPSDVNARRIGKYRTILKDIEAACAKEGAPSPITVQAAQGLYL